MRDYLSSFLEAFEADLRTLEPTAAVKRQLARYRKKAILLNDSDLSESAKSDFILTNYEAGQIKINLSADELSKARYFIERALWRVYDTPQCTFDLGTVLREWRFGPGASLGAKGLTHFVDKVIQPSGSVSSSALPYAKLLRLLNPYLRAYDCQEGYEFLESNASKLSTVPKNETTHRTICTEPLWNMALQLAFGQSVERALARLGHSISDQPEINKVLARVGSERGHLCTIDLRSASDLITPELVRLLWPSDCYHFMMAIRSHTTTINGKHHVLNMMSTMGNGFTFPVMTLTLLSLVSVCLDFQDMWIPFDKVGVFGDDIIIPTQYYSDMIDLLHRAGLEVNQSKSYAYGTFRESCGGDYDLGVDITPIYVKTLHDHASLNVVTNQLLGWMQREGVTCPRSLRFLSQLHAEIGGAYLVPLGSDLTSGILTRFPPRRYKSLQLKPLVRRVRKERINPDIQMLIALGGYASDGGGTFSFSPRTDKSSFETVKRVNPKGFTGWLGSRDTSSKFYEAVIDVYFRKETHAVP